MPRRSPSRRFPTARIAAILRVSRRCRRLSLSLRDARHPARPSRALPRRRRRSTALRAAIRGAKPCPYGHGDGLHRRARSHRPHPSIPSRRSRASLSSSSTTPATASGAAGLPRPARSAHHCGSSQSPAQHGGRAPRAAPRARTSSCTARWSPRAARTPGRERSTPVRAPRGPIQLLDAAFASVPGAMGMNNHMGSKATADPALMTDVIGYLKSHGLLFIDSRTTADTVGARIAQEHGRAGHPAGRVHRRYHHGRGDLRCVREGRRGGAGPWHRGAHRPCTEQGRGRYTARRRSGPSPRRACASRAWRT